MTARLPPPFGRLIDRNRVVTFRFDGEPLNGLAGDTLASALLANDRQVFSRSFKYHRPRGILTMAGQDANTLVQGHADPNALADRLPLSDGLSATGQNVVGSLDKDRRAWIGLFARFLPVAFYYKAFYRPRGAWNLWSQLFRRFTGLGVIDQTHEPDGYDKQYRFCDVAVIGGGAAGLAAALEAAAAGAEVLLIEENVTLGGALNYSRLDIAGEMAWQQREALVSAVTQNDAIEVMTGATANGWYADHYLPVIQGKRLYKLRARQVILCPGALEQPAIFRNNDLPGVMMAGAAGRLMHLYGLRPGRRAVVLTGNRDGYATALDLLAAGVEVAAVVDLRRHCNDDLAAAVKKRGVEQILDHAVYSARAGADRNRLGSVAVRKILAQGKCSGDSRRIDCDLLCMAVGEMPAWQLACMAGAQLGYDDTSARFRLDGLPDGLHLAGAANGRGELTAAIADGRRAAAGALAALDLCEGAEQIEPIARDAQRNFPWPIFPHPKGKEFVDLDEDLQIADILNATADGYDHVQLVKRYSTCGMGPSQGRQSALATARLVADATGKTVEETGVTTARPPFAAETLAHCAGRRFYPARRSSMHDRHIEAGAQMLQAGDWTRPAYYGAPADREACILAEALAVRTGVGIVDVSTLGGIEVCGADAGEFMNRVYTMGFAKQPVGRARYALLTNEAGVVIDDGVACRFAADHYYVTATTGGAGRVFQALLKWNAQWRLDVDLANVTSAYCGVNIAGPASRRVLARLCDEPDVSADAFGYLGVRAGEVAGIPARLLRVGFVGELGFEIHVPQHSGEALWDALLDAGRQEGIRPFGIEAQRLLRLEKGHVIIGQDTDALSNPLELDMGWAIGRQKPFFVGGRTLDVLRARPLTRVLVGFVIPNRDVPVPRESQLIIRHDRMIGRVTSAGYSPGLEATIGLAYVPPEQAAPGTPLQIRGEAGQLCHAEVVKLPFYDPDNARQEL